MGMGPTQDSCPTQVHKTPIGGGRVGLGPTWVNLNSALLFPTLMLGLGRHFETNALGMEWLHRLHA